MPKDNWTQISLAPLSGMLDTRSRPAEMSPGTFRYKLNMSINRTGSLCARSGHAALNFGSRSDAPSAVPNWDFHRRNTLTPRESPNFIFESTALDGVRNLFVGTPSGLAVMDNGTSEWTVLNSGATDAYWQGACLNGFGYFTQGYSAGTMMKVDLSTMGIGAFTWNSNPLTKVRVVVAFADVVMLMNMVEDGVRQSARIWWSDYQQGDVFTVGGASLAGFQDLDYGEEILNAAEMMGALYIFTTKSIWRCVTNITDNSIFAFQKIYSEPKNQNGCLAYANTLVTTGRELYWWSRDSIWTFNPYVVAPESPDWLLRGSGAIFSPTNADRMDKDCCESIVSGYDPGRKEVWFSYPQAISTASGCVNNRCLVLNIEYKTADLVDQGYSAFANFRVSAESFEACNADHVFIGASTTDYCLKSIGNVFYRETVALAGNNPANDIPDLSYVTTQDGYFCRVVGTIPLGFPNRNKTVRELLLDADVTPNDLEEPNLLKLRIGNSEALQDSLSEDEYCGPQWHEQDDLQLNCPDSVTLAKMAERGQNPSDSLSWTIFEAGKYLYYDLLITASDGETAPVKHDVAFSAFRFDVRID